MTSEYRQKLLNWLTSMAILMAVTVFSLAAKWFLGLWMMTSVNTTDKFADIAGPMGEAFLAYPIFFLPLLVWHSFDFIQEQKPNSRWAANLSSYPPLLASIAISGIAFILISSGEFTVMHCPEPMGPEFGFQHCFHGPATWLNFLFYMPLLISFLLCISKAIFSIRTYLKKVI
ncbi:hypothetical protein C8024_01805 [Sphingopyxis sp. BSNA05]|uniref:hypothetical protein n=1 Tax=Sphingopyxis sp. BSNA05 TaxID=1236614 RepID=UPI001564CF73|nr:hypothetical protein [Sphingopyxis sp. BSNA05]NRD88465.1 hypothetical protein [Sphingopyxis sp. BSNA05]